MVGSRRRCDWAGRRAYAALGQYEQAIKYHEQALAIDREIGDRRGEGNSTDPGGIGQRCVGHHELIAQIRFRDRQDGPA